VEEGDLVESVVEVVVEEDDLGNVVVGGNCAVVEEVVGG
jgi:hypothetical protein